MRFRSLLPAFVLFAASACAHACSITYDNVNSSNGVYKYNVVEPGTNGATLVSGEKFVFTGLSGVTGASSLYSSYISTSFTATSVTYTLLANVYLAYGTYADVFSIASSVLTPGTVRYALTGTSISGSVSGPVGTSIAPTPEPGSLMLLGTGVLGVAGVVRRRFAKA